MTGNIPVGPSGAGPVGRLFLVCPLATCLALEPNPRHCDVSVRYLFTGETHNITSNLASPPLRNEGIHETYWESKKKSSPFD